MITWNRRDSTPLSAAPRAPKNYQDEDKKSAINLKKINSQIKKPHLKRIPNKRQLQDYFWLKKINNKKINTNSKFDYKNALKIKQKGIVWDQ